MVPNNYWTFQLETLTACFDLLFFTFRLFIKSVHQYTVDDKHTGISLVEKTLFVFPPAKYSLEFWVHNWRKMLT